MIKKVRNFFFLEEAKASGSDIAVMVLVAISLVLAAYAVASGWRFI
ncbi:MAG: hypothetical protein ABS942_15740 [Solibacillus sp.]